MSFFLEVFGLVGLGRWGWTLGNGGFGGGVLAVAFIAVAGTVWGVFRARDFVPRGGKPTVAIPGVLRLVLELALYALATVGFWTSGWTTAAALLGAATVVVYAGMRERVAGLMRQP
jgi:hypothetical protein